MDVDTDHGHYDVLPARESDSPPAGATHAVFHESGELAGFAKEGPLDACLAYRPDGHGVGPAHATLYGAAAEVAWWHGRNA